MAMITLPKRLNEQPLTRQPGQEPTAANVPRVNPTRPQPNQVNAEQFGLSGAQGAIESGNDFQQLGERLQIQAQKVQIEEEALFLKEETARYTQELSEIKAAGLAEDINLPNYGPDSTALRDKFFKDNQDKSQNFQRRLGLAIESVRRHSVTEVGAEQWGRRKERILDSNNQNANKIIQMNPATSNIEEQMQTIIFLANDTEVNGGITLTEAVGENIARDQVRQQLANLIDRHFQTAIVSLAADPTNVDAQKNALMLFTHERATEILLAEEIAQMRETYKTTLKAGDDGTGKLTGPQEKQANLKAYKKLTGLSDEALKTDPIAQQIVSGVDIDVGETSDLKKLMDGMAILQQADPAAFKRFMDSGSFDSAVQGALGAKQTELSATEERQQHLVAYQKLTGLSNEALKTDPTAQQIVSGVDIGVGEISKVKQLMDGMAILKETNPAAFKRFVDSGSLDSAIQGALGAKQTEPSATEERQQHLVAYQKLTGLSNEALKTDPVAQQIVSGVDIDVGETSKVKQVMDSMAILKEMNPKMFKQLVDDGSFASAVQGALGAKQTELSATEQKFADLSIINKQRIAKNQPPLTPAEADHFYNTGMLPGKVKWDAQKKLEAQEELKRMFPDASPGAVNSALGLTTDAPTKLEQGQAFVRQINADRKAMNKANENVDGYVPIPPLSNEEAESILLEGKKPEKSATEKANERLAGFQAAFTSPDNQDFIAIFGKQALGGVFGLSIKDSPEKRAKDLHDYIAAALGKPPTEKQMERALKIADRSALINNNFGKANELAKRLDITAANRFSEVFEKGSKASSTLNEIAIQRLLIKEGGFKTGFATGGRVWLARMIHFFGAEQKLSPGLRAFLGSAPTADAMESNNAKFITDFASEMGRITNMSLRFAQDRFPSLMRTPRGNELILEMMEHAANVKIAHAQLIDKFLSDPGNHNENGDPVLRPKGRKSLQQVEREWIKSQTEWIPKDLQNRIKDEGDKIAKDKNLAGGKEFWKQFLADGAKPKNTMPQVGIPDSLEGSTRLADKDGNAVFDNKDGTYSIVPLDQLNQHSGKKKTKNTTLSDFREQNNIEVTTGKGENFAEVFFEDRDGNGRNIIEFRKAGKFKKQDIIDAETLHFMGGARANGEPYHPEFFDLKQQFINAMDGRQTRFAKKKYREALKKKPTGSNFSNYENFLQHVFTDMEIRGAMFPQLMTHKEDREDMETRRIFNDEQLAILEQMDEIIK